MQLSQLIYLLVANSMQNAKFGLVHVRAGVGNLFTITGRINCGLSLAGRK